MIQARLVLQVILLLGIAAAPFALYGYAHQRGAESVRQQWLADRAIQQAEIKRLQAQFAAAAAKVVTEYVDRVQVVRERGKTIVREVPVYVPSDSCDLPAGFRVLHDAAATGSDVPSPAGRTDAAAVPARDAAATVASNYATCHEISQRLRSLQQWAAGLGAHQ